MGPILLQIYKFYKSVLTCDLIIGYYKKSNTFWAKIQAAHVIDFSINLSRKTVEKQSTFRNWIVSLDLHFNILLFTT